MHVNLHYERGPLSLVITIEELLGRKSIGSGLEAENTTAGICLADNATHSIRKTLALTSPTSGGRSVGIVRSFIEATKFSYFSA
jgi:hypothetical protein